MPVLPGRIGRFGGEPPAIPRKPAAIVLCVIGPERSHPVPVTGEGFRQTPAGIGIRSAFQADKLRARDEFCRPARSMIRTFDQQHAAESAYRRQRKQKASARVQRIEPCPAWLGGACAHIDRIGSWQVVRDAGSRLHVDLRQASQVLAGAGRKPGIDFVGMNPPAGADQMRDDRGVVTGPCAYLKNGLALLQIECRKPTSMPAWLTDVDASGAVQCHKRVLI